MTTTTAPASTVATAPGRRPPKRQKSWPERVLRKRGPGVFAFAVFIGLWHLSILVFDPNPILFPGPVEVWDEWTKAAADGSTCLQNCPVQVSPIGPPSCAGGGGPA